MTESLKKGVAILSNDLGDFIWAAKNLSETHKVTTQSLIRILEAVVEKD